ncbi:NIPSNAP family protein [Akkermansiaceae bacterium]|nr:NIPSNAP family protein [Akkermansiaceae bacterium]
MLRRLLTMLKTLAILALAALPLSADVYELRTYTANEGKLEALLSRFRDHTLEIFESHGMKNIGYWVTEGDDKKLVYIISHKDSAAAKASWAAFRKDPKWQAAYKASTADGKLVKKVDSQYLAPTDFSKLK